MWLPKSIRESIQTYAWQLETRHHQVLLARIYAIPRYRIAQTCFVLDDKALLPNNGKVFAGQDLPGTFPHGADLNTGKAYSLELELHPGSAKVTHTSTLGNPGAITIETPNKVPVEVKKMHVRTLGPDGPNIEVIEGEQAIRDYLK